MEYGFYRPVVFAKPFVRPFFRPVAYGYPVFRRFYPVPISPAPFVYSRIDPTLAYGIRPWYYPF